MISKFIELGYYTLQVKKGLSRLNESLKLKTTN